MPAFLMDYPFAESLYPAALSTLSLIFSWGPTVILWDGDGVFQLCKAQRLGFVGRGQSRVLIYLHKEQMLLNFDLHLSTIEITGDRYSWVLD